MSQRNNPVISAVEDRPFKVVHPTQQEIDGYVREAQRMRAEAVANLLRGFWRVVTGRRSQPVGVPSYPAKA